MSNDSPQDRLLYFRPRARWREGAFDSATLSTQLQGINEVAADGNAHRLFVVSSGRQHGELVRYDLSKQSFAIMLPGASATYVDVAKDLQLVAYVNSQDNTLWVSRFDGAGRRQLDSAGMSVQLPRWSPDGKSIAFMGKQPKRPWRIFIAPVAGGKPKEASQSDDNQGAPTWSPDGKSLVYGNVDCEGEETCAIHKIDVANGEVTKLPDSQGLGTARWSPDGKHIAALNPAQHKLVVFDVGRREWRALAENVNGNDISWSSDSRFIYSRSSMNGQASILRVPESGGSVQTVLNLRSFSQETGELDTWFSLTPDNELLLNRWLNTSEIYALSYREQ
jgi:dipeptidyl aminopeptidase/acylaminoacyl peptidase